jgi:hypothetical protein
MLTMETQNCLSQKKTPQISKDQESLKHLTLLVFNSRFAQPLRGPFENDSQENRVRLSIEKVHDLMRHF